MTEQTCNARTLGDEHVAYRPGTESAIQQYRKTRRPLPPRTDAGGSGNRELLVAHHAGSHGREALERFIRTEFRDHFGARIETFMPVLVGLHDAHGKVLGAVGCRGAADEALFLETYTRSPIESVIADKVGVAVPREEIVEVGSLACRDARIAAAMVQALVPYLLDAGYKWVVFTGADTVVRVFRRLHLLPHELCVARRDLLDERLREMWGSYYDHDPRVMAGRLLDGIQTLGRLVTAE